jgi:hypothetical protein
MDGRNPWAIYALEGGIIALDSQHRVVDELTDGRSTVVAVRHIPYPFNPGILLMLFYGRPTDRVEPPRGCGKALLLVYAHFTQKSKANLPSATGTMGEDGGFAQF